MAGEVLVNKAVRGRVLAIDANHREQGPNRMVTRPLVTLRSPDPCVMPVGRELWWSEQSAGREFVVEEVRPGPGGGSDVVLKLMTSSGDTALPSVGSLATFSIHTTGASWSGTLPDTDPWTHQSSASTSSLDAIEDTATEI
jgi:hypothetical protein